jgi:hypothetical protein
MVAELDPYPVADAVIIVEPGMSVEENHVL